MSMISPSSYQAVCSAAQASRKTPAATAAASSVNLRGRVTTVEHGEGDEGEEPRDVEIEPVRQHELEPDQDCGGEGGELQDRLPTGHEREEHRARGDEHLQDLLEDVEIRHALRPVLAPAPDRERRLAVELEAKGSLGEHTRGMQRVRLEQEHEESGEGRAGEAEGEAAGGRPPPVGVGEPERRE